MDRLYAKLICPYCGFEQNFSVISAWGHELRVCDSEDGGCSGTFVVGYKANLTTVVKRVEGEEMYAAERKAELEQEVNM